ncbi:MAG: insulinase family protein [Deltaproteobacteria bacterium]|nr:insulinase family protein [Deltaproteobacteria bacterium]
MRRPLCAPALAAVCLLLAGCPPAAVSVVSEASETPSSWEHTPPPDPLPASPVSPARVADTPLLSGLRVVVVEQHRRPVVVVQLVLPRGSAGDPAEQAGRTNLAVKLLSDYYERSPSGTELVDEKSFRRQVAEAGGAPSVVVSSDFALLGIAGYAQDTPRYLRLLAAAVLSPRQGAHSFSSRRNAALDALEDLEVGDPEAFALYLAQIPFGVGHPYARPVLGTVPALENLSLDEVIARQRELLTPRGATLLIVGDVEARRVLSEAKAALGSWQGPARQPQTVAAPALPGKKRDVAFIPRESASTVVACASRALSDVQGADAALDVLAAVLGAGPHGRLAASLRERHRLTYDANAKIVRLRYARAFLACSRLNADRVEEGIRVFRETLASIEERAPEEAELARAKAQLHAELDAASEDVRGLAGLWLEAIVEGRGAPELERRRAEIEKVNAEDVQKLARRVLAPATLRWIFSGERSACSQAIEANGLGRLRVLHGVGW